MSRALRLGSGSKPLTQAGRVAARVHEMVSRDTAFARLRNWKEKKA
jgi:hypothetical protein